MNFIISIFCSVILGYLCATFLFDSKANTDDVFLLNNQIYFLQTEFSSNSSEEINYIIVESEEGDDLYVGMTTSLENAKKIQEEYKKLGIELFIEEGQVDSEEFVSELTQYDILLSSSKTYDEINSVLATILASYEEFVLSR